MSLLVLMSAGYLEGIAAGILWATTLQARIAVIAAVVAVVTTLVASVFTGLIQDIRTVGPMVFGALNWTFLVTIAIILALGMAWLKRRSQIQRP
jgi:hypothetical protein